MTGGDATPSPVKNEAPEANGNKKENKETKGLSPFKNRKEEWKLLEENARALKSKIDRDILNKIEKIEDFHYKNMRGIDAIRQKISEDWGFFESEINRSIDRLKQEQHERSTRMSDDINAKKTDLDGQFKQWEHQYQEWSSKTRKNMKDTMASWSIAGWKFYVSFLIVVVPIVIIIVVLANVFK